MAERLEPVRGLQTIWRGVYEAEHRGHSYAVEVDYFDFAERIHLYRDGARIPTERSPARFDIDGGGAAIEARMGLLGMRDLFLEEAGRELALRPASGTLEARRAGFERGHPRASRVLGVLAWLILAVALVIEIPALIALAADAIGLDFDPPLELPPGVLTVLGIAALAAALDRALRFKHSRWLD
jgi:hypothetical protein